MNEKEMGGNDSFTHSDPFPSSNPDENEMNNNEESKEREKEENPILMDKDDNNENENLLVHDRDEMIKNSWIQCRMALESLFNNQPISNHNFISQIDPSIFLDTIWLLDVHDNESKRLHLVQLLGSRSDIPAKMALEYLEPELLEAAGIITSASAMQKKLIRINTSLFYKQHKFNLLEEEPKGYAKLIFILYEMQIDEVDSYYSIILQLIGYYDLCPNRVIDILLDMLCVGWQEKSAIIIKLLKKFNSPSDHLAELMGFKIMNRTELESLSMAMAILLNEGLFSLDEILLYAQGIHVHLLWALLSCYSLELAKNLLFHEFDPKITLSQNDFILIGPVISAIIHTIIDREILSATMDESTRPLYLNHFKFPINIFGNGNEINNDSNIKSNLPTNDKELELWLYFAGPFGISQDLTLISNLCHYMRRQMERQEQEQEQEKDDKEIGNDKDGNIENDQEMRWANIMVKFILPACQVTRPTLPPSTAHNVFLLLNKWSFKGRFEMYLDNEYNVKESIQESSLMIKRSLKRLSKENTRQVARGIAKWLQGNIKSLFIILEQARAYENLVEPLVESLRYLGPLAMDALVCFLKESFDPGRERLQVTLISSWLQNLSLFTGLLFKRYPNLDMIPILEYLLNQLNGDGIFDLVILKEIIEKMTGCESRENISDIMIEALGGGPILKSEMVSLAKTVNKRRIIKLYDILQSCQLTIPLWIILGRLKDRVLDYDLPDKIASNLSDQCQQLFLQYTEFICLSPWVQEEREKDKEREKSKMTMETENNIAMKMEIDPRENIENKILKIIPSITTLVEEYNLGIEIAYHILRNLQKINRESHFNFLREKCTFLDFFYSLELYDIFVPTARYQNESLRLKTIQMTNNPPSITTITTTSSSSSPLVTIPSSSSSNILTSNDSHVNYGNSNNNGNNHLNSTITTNTGSLSDLEKWKREKERASHLLESLEIELKNHMIHVQNINQIISSRIASDPLTTPVKNINNHDNDNDAMNHSIASLTIDANSGNINSPSLLLYSTSSNSPSIPISPPLNQSFIPQDKDSLLQFYNSSIRKRMLLSPIDSIYSAKFIWSLHSSIITLHRQSFNNSNRKNDDNQSNTDGNENQTANQTEMENENKIKNGNQSAALMISNFMDIILQDLKTILWGITEFESKCYGRFIHELYLPLIQWYNNPSRIESDSFFPFESYEDYKILLVKWHNQLEEACVCSLGSNNYAPIRNAILFLTKLVDSVFPIFKSTLLALESLCMRIRERDERDDIKVLATRYLSMLQNAGKRTKLPFTTTREMEREDEKISFLTLVNTPNSSVSSSSLAEIANSHTKERERDRDNGRDRKRIEKDGHGERMDIDEEQGEIIVNTDTFIPTLSEGDSSRDRYHSPHHEDDNYEEPKKKLLKLQTEEQKKREILLKRKNHKKDEEETRKKGEGTVEKLSISKSLPTFNLSTPHPSSPTTMTTIEKESKKEKEMNKISTSNSNQSNQSSIINTSNKNSKSTSIGGNSAPLTRSTRNERENGSESVNSPLISSLSIVNPSSLSLLSQEKMTNSPNSSPKGGNIRENLKRLEGKEREHGHGREKGDREERIKKRDQDYSKEKNKKDSNMENEKGHYHHKNHSSIPSHSSSISYSSFHSHSQSSSLNNRHVQHDHHGNYQKDSYYEYEEGLIASPIYPSSSSYNYHQGRGDTGRGRDYDQFTDDNENNQYYYSDQDYYYQQQQQQQQYEQNKKKR